MADTEYVMSPSLIEAFGFQDRFIKQHELVKSILDYAKENNLISQDKITIQCDEVLKELIGKSVTSAFSCIRDMKYHIKEIIDISNSDSDSEIDLESESDSEKDTDSETDTDTEVEPYWNRYISLQNADGESLFLQCFQLNEEGPRIIRINNFILTERSFQEYVHRITGENEEQEQEEYSKENTFEILIYSFFFAICLVSFSLWLSIMHQNTPTSH